MRAQCRARLLSGRIDYPAGPPLGVSAQEADQGYVLLCQAHARTDLVIEARLIRSAAAAEIKTLPSRVARRVLLAPDVMRLVLRVPSVESLQFSAGQYLDVLLEGGRRRSYSVANAQPGASQFELHVRHVPGGRFSEAVFGTLREGDLLKIEGPLGRFTRQAGTRPVIFVAGGTGFAPIKAMLAEALREESPHALHLYWGARDAAGIYEEALVRDWVGRHPRLTLNTVLSQAAAVPGSHRAGWVHEAVLEDYRSLAPFTVYAAGPPAMIAAIRATFPGRGLPPEQLHLDSFDYATT